MPYLYLAILIRLRNWSIIWYMIYNAVYLFILGELVNSNLCYWFWIFQIKLHFLCWLWIKNFKLLDSKICHSLLYFSKKLKEVFTIVWKIEWLKIIKLTISVSFIVTLYEVTTLTMCLHKRWTWCIVYFCFLYTH